MALLPAHLDFGSGGRCPVPTLRITGCASLHSCPVSSTGQFSAPYASPTAIPTCQRKDVNIREGDIFKPAWPATKGAVQCKKEDSFKFTVDVMRDEKVIAVMTISRSLWFAGEDHIQTSFSFGDILLSQLSVPYICQYSKSTGLFAVTMLFSHTSCDQSVKACRPVKVHRHLPHPQNPRPQNPPQHPQRQLHPVRFERGHLHHNQRRRSHQQSWQENQNQRRHHHREHGTKDSVVEVAATEQAARKAQGLI